MSDESLFINRNTPIVDPVPPAGPMVRIIGSDGQDTISAGAFAYARRDDGSFEVPESIVEQLTRGASFRRAALSNGARLRDVVDAVNRLDAGPSRTALRAAIAAEALTLAGLTPPVASTGV
jgi:hypothetical protein